MVDESIIFKVEEGLLGKFMFIYFGKDLLNFEGGEVFYDFKIDEFSVSGVFYLIVVDVFVYLDSNFVRIGQDGEMVILENVRIVVDIFNQNYVIKWVMVDVKGCRFYQVLGFYEYNVGDWEQEIEFENIVG